MPPTVSVTFDNLGEAAELERGTWPEGQPLGELYPEALSGLAAAGHEVACHGWRHEPWAELDPDRERELLGRARTALGAPAGFRPPGGRLTEQGAGLLSELGFGYCSPAGSRPGRRSRRAALPLAADRRLLLPAPLRRAAAEQRRPGGADGAGRVARHRARRPR